MGDDAHEGLKHWLDKFHQPTVPGYTIITDPEYFVFLWFHDANGRLINCPYTKGKKYVPRLKSTSVDFDSVNSAFNDQVGIQSGNQNLPEQCIDLTPFVREATLPDISP